MQKVLANSTKMCYTYDDLSRVTSRTVKNIDNDDIISVETYSYDAAGNITDAPDSCFAYDTNNRLTAFCGQPVTYDCDGNMLNNGVSSFTYDSANRLVSAGGHTYTYNAEDVRIRNLCTDEDTTYTYDTNCKLSRLLTKTTNGSVTKYVYGMGLIGEQLGGMFYTYHFDYRGSTIALTDANGNVTDTFAYDTYGKLNGRTGVREIIFGYNGRDGVVTDDNGLIYMRARYYSPDMRRFINADVVAGEITNAITLNRFAYANGNPVSLSDPFGLSAADQRGNPPSQNKKRPDSYDIRYARSINKSNRNDLDIASLIVGLSNGSITLEDYCKTQELLNQIASIDTSGMVLDQTPMEKAKLDRHMYMINQYSLTMTSAELQRLRWEATQSAVIAMWTLADEYINNEDPEVVRNAGWLSFYNGVPVIKVQNQSFAFSFGAIVIGDEWCARDTFAQTLEHEYGHVLQLREYGLLGYIKFVAIPSVTGNIIDQILYKEFGYDYPYYSQPWEYEPDMLVGLNRVDYYSKGVPTYYNYEPWADIAYSVYKWRVNKYVNARNSIIGFGFLP